MCVFWTYSYSRSQHTHADLEHGLQWDASNKRQFVVIRQIITLQMLTFLNQLTLLSIVALLLFLLVYTTLIGLIEYQLRLG